MKKILICLSIVFFYSNFVHAQGLGTLRDNTKVRTSEFVDTTTYMQSRIDDIINSTLTPRIPTVYVCASNSPAELKAIAQYVCDGHDDVVEINQAIQYLAGTASKGLVQLEAGTFVADGDVLNDIILSSNVTISGRGVSTILLVNGGRPGDITAPIYGNGAINAVLENLVIDGDYTLTQNFASITNCNNLIIRNCRFINPSYGSVTISNGNNIKITDNYIEGIMGVSSLNIIGLTDSIISNNTLAADPSVGAGIGISISAGSGIILNKNITRGAYQRGIRSTASKSIISNNTCNNGANYGFDISGASNTIVGNSAFENGTANALISATRSKDESNSWNSDQLNIDGSNAMTGNLNMGNNAINFCPTIMTSTADVAALKTSTAGLQAQQDLDVSTNMAQWNLGYTNQSDITKVEASTKIVTDNQANWTEAYNVVKTSGDDWSKQSAVVISSIPALSSHKATEDAINGIMKVNGSGTYSAITDNSSNWDMAASSVAVQISSHVVNTNNPHGVTKAQVGLSSVTNDSQLKRSSADFTTFTAKTNPDGNDVILIEDAGASQAKKYILISNISHANLANIGTRTHAQLEYDVDTTTKTFDIEFATATVGERVNVPFGSTGTVTDVYFTALVPPAGSNFTMTISSTNYNGTINASMGTITILAGAYVSNVLTLNQVIARRSGLVFEVTGAGSTTAGFNIGGFIKYYKSRSGGN
jgi:hypothetical protein